ncbi:MAG: RNA 2',3'-cyclic phosphodiesterase [Thaumarchaeota archaeon]|nr:RNA 2',3'-cyclic phosphodiesterase [Nitrososphaerota archaeon]
MRAFLAFETSPTVIDNLLAVEEELRKTKADVKLVDRENLHFTVKFLGEIPENVVAEIDKRIGGLALAKMEVGVRGLGAFPDTRRPRVVWAGVSRQDEPAASKSAQEVIDALRGVGEEDERRYHPHITVARVRSPRNQEELVKVIRDYSDSDFGRTTITALKLKSSTLTPNGPIYRDVREYALQ